MLIVCALLIQLLTLLPRSNGQDSTLPAPRELQVEVRVRFTEVAKIFQYLLFFLGGFSHDLCIGIFGMVGRRSEWRRKVRRENGKGGRGSRGDVAVLGGWWLVE